MKIIEYNKNYEEDVKDLLVELEEYIISIDEDELDQIHNDYRDKIIELDLKEVYENEGKCLIAVDEFNKAIGVIMGIIRKYEEFDYLDYKCPKSGEITELVVSKKARSKGVGKHLMNSMQEYFKNKNCEYIFVDVFAYNKNAINFYSKDGYHSRMEIMVKKI